MSGKVSDIQSNQPLNGAVVEVVGETNSTGLTNQSGDFTLRTDIREGWVRISMVGYKPMEIRFRMKNFLYVQMEADVKSLNEVLVTAFGEGNTIRKTAGAISILTGSQMRQGDGTSIQQAMNSIPGVRMDHSNGEDSKISIRGEGVRAPWGNRGIKIYVNDIPLTETDGTSRIEALDVSDLGRAEIIKGPASSLYGGGVGGVIKFQLERAPYHEQSMEATTMFGSYGLNRQTITYRNGGEKFNSYISLGRQHADGYRANSSDQRDFLAGNFQWFPTVKQTITMLVSHTRQHALLPGPLNKQEMNQNPRQADPEYVEKKSSRTHNWTRIGVGQKYVFNDHFSNSTSVFTYFYDLHHPLPFGIINSAYQSYGGRTTLEYNPSFITFPTKFIVGAEYTHAFTMGNIYGNDHGIEDGLMSNVDYNNNGYSVFYQSNTTLGRFGNLTAGISANGLSYRAMDRLHPEQSGIKRFRAQLSPRIALSHEFGDWLVLHGMISSGFTNPASDQVQNPDLSINRKIQAEKGTNYEIDAKGNLFGSRMNYDLSLFRMNMKGELIGQTLPLGNTIYRNSGSTLHEGIEIGTGYQLLREGDNHFFSIIYPRLALTYSHFVFRSYKDLGESGEVIADYHDNPLTGIAPWMVNFSLLTETKAGIYLRMNSFFNDRYTLNDNGTDYNPSYFLMNVRMGYKHSLSTHFGTEFYIGLQNITNTKYSSFTDLNAVVAVGQTLPRYFYPSPDRNIYGGVGIKYYFKKNDK